MEKAEFESKSVNLAFCCNWAAYFGSDLAGTAWISHRPDMKAKRIPCLGMAYVDFVKVILETSDHFQKLARPVKNEV